MTRSPLHRVRALPVLWRVFLIDVLILGTGALVLAFGPVTISYPVRGGELAVIVAGLVAMLAVSLLLLSRTLRPLRVLTRTMREVDLLAPGRRVEIPDAGPDVNAVATAFNEMLTRLEAERRESGRMALSIQEEERRRIARELHDEVGQTLTAMLLQIEGLAGDLPEHVRAELEELRETARTGAEDVRRIAQRLRPEALEELGLQAALLALVDGVGRQAGLAIERDIERELPLTTDDELVVYRVAQEALTNVVRHSGARNVALALGRRGDRVVLRVTDDGRGIEPGELDSSYGIRGMRERALLVEATLRIDTAAGRGTTIELDVPAEPEEQP